MNLFKKQKFSIRKFSVGTFSTLIATLVFLSHPGHAATHDAETNTSAPQTNESATINKQNTNIEQPHNETTSANTSNSNENNRNNESNTSSDYSINREREEGTVNNVINSTENNTNHNEKVTTNDVVSNENNHETTNVNQPHRRGKRSVDNTPSTTNTDPMAVNEQNTGQIINGTFTDNSQGATIPTKNLESAMNEANTVPGWHVNSNDQTIIPLIWGPKSLPAYNPYIFDKTNNKIGVVLSKYNGNFNQVPGIADPTVGSIYQDVDVTPGSEIQLHYISSSMNNIWGVNGARVYIYDANNPSTLLYKGTPDILQNPIGNFVGVFQVPETVSRLRLRFESALNRSTDSTNGHRLLTGPNNFGGGVLADVTINSGAYLTATVNNTHYFAQSGSINADRVYQEIGFRIENRGHSSSNKTEYTIVLPEDVTYVSTKNATGKFNAATKELTVKIDRLEAGASKNISIGLSLPTDRPIEKEFLGHLTYVTDGINMNRLSDSKDFGRNNGDHYTRYGVHNEFVSVDSAMRQGDIVLDKQTITVKMYKQHLRDKVTEIEDDLANLDQNDNSPEVWEAMQVVLRKAKEVLAETDEMPISELKDQATINSIDLNLDKAHAKLSLDKVARTKRALFMGNDTATIEEKNAVIEQVNQALQSSYTAVDQSMTSNDVATNKDTGINEITMIDLTPTVKQAAIDELTERANAKKVEFDNNPDATVEEKEAAKAKVDQAVTEAKGHINEAINNSGVDEAKTNGTTTINAIQPEVIKKSEARQAIDDAARAKKEAIDQTPGATTEEKEAAKAKVDQAVTEAKGHINEAINNSGVDEAKTNGTTTINAIQPEVIKKSEARQAIDDAARAKKEAIDQTPDATTEEKEAAKAKVDQAVTEAKAHINEAINNSGVDEAKTNGTNTINAIQPEITKKIKAREAIDEVARAKKEAIDRIQDATTEEKEAAKAKVDQAVTEAKGHINEAINNSGVDETKTNGTTTINAIQPEIIKKSEARQAIDDVAKAKKEAIDQTPDATTEEKEAAKAKVDQAVTEAKAHINEAITNSDVDEAKTNGTNTINAIQPDVLKKSEARQAIDNEVINKKTEIDNNVDATIEEKEAAKSKVDEAAVEAKNNINHTEINQAVDQAKEDGVTTVSHIQPNIVKKIAAKTAIDEVARIKKEAIDQTPGATTEEKEAAKSKVDEAATEARNNINRALSNNDVDQVVHNSTASINNIQPDIVKKEQAKRGIDTQAKIKKAIIDQTSDATTEEKEAAKSKVDEEVTKAKHSIDQAVTNSDVDQAKDRGTVAINNIQPEVVKKETAKTSIDQIALTRKNIIDQTPDATTEEKEVAKSKVDEEVTKAKRNINQAVTNNDVNQVEHNSTIAINNIQPNIIKKIAAKTLIDQVARAKKNNIDQTSNATIEEKEAAKQKVDEEVTKAKHSIDQAITNSDVDQAKDRGTVAINNIQPEVVKKETAKNAIDQIALTRKAIIDQTPDATTEEKEAAKSKVDEEVIKAKHGIDQAKTNNDVDQVEQNSTTMINNIQPTVVKKSEARQAIDDLAKLKKATIDLTQEATEEEKEAAKSKVDQALTEAKTHINEAENDDGVDNAKTKGINVINTIQLEIIKKVEAKHEIDQSAIAKKKIIDQTPDATEEEKEVAKQKVDEEATKAKDNIDQATTNDAVDQAKTTGNTEINNIQPEVVKKSLARQAIDEVAKVKKEKINQMLDATEEEKEAAKQKVDEEVIKAKNNINQATTNDGVNNAKTTGKNTIENIQPEVVKKAEARKAIDEAATLRKNLIDQDNSTTKEEKDIAKQKIDDEVNKAKRNVDQSINNSNVDHAQINGISAINNINVVALKKTQAKKSIDDEVTAKKAEIDSNHEATNEEKEMTKRKVDEAATKAKHNVDQSTTNDTVDQSTQIGISIISNIQPETIQKSLARQAIDDEATIKKAEIENNHNATKEEKDVARQKVDEEVIKAKNNIAQSTTNSDVEIAKESGKHAIDEIQPEIVKKSVAKQTIDELAKQKKAEIDQTPNATKEEKDAAKQKVEEAVMRAKKLLEGANTNSDVDQTTEQGKQSINSIQVEVIKKADALSKLEVELQKLKDKVSSDQTFTIDEKLFIKQKLDESYKKAEEKVNQAQTNKQVDNIKIHYLQEFNKIVLIDKVKLKAKAQIFDVANKRKAYIKGLTNISEYNRNKAYKQIDVYVMKALNKLVENVTTNDINELTRVTINEIEHVNVKQFENNFGLVNDNKVTFNNFNNKFNVNNNHSKLNTLPYTGENENSLLSLAEFTLLSGLLLLLKRRKKEDK